MTGGTVDPGDPETLPMVECWCMTAADLGMGYGEGINPDMIAYYHPECPTHHGGDCQTRIRSTPPWCAHDQAWEVDVYSPGSERWQTLRVCDPCMDDFRTRHFDIRAERQLNGTRRHRDA